MNYLELGGVVNKSSFCLVGDGESKGGSYATIALAGIVASALLLATAKRAHGSCFRAYEKLGAKDDVFAVRKKLATKGWIDTQEASDFLLRSINNGGVGVFRLLRKEGVRVPKEALLIALENRRGNMLPELLKVCDCSVVDKKGNTALMVAIQKNLPQEVDLILEELTLEGINAQNQKGQTALHLAAGEYTDFVEKLVNAGASSEIKDNNGEVPLHVAATFDNADSITKMLHAGANPNLQNNNGETPLQKVVFFGGGRLKAAEALLQSSTINPNILNEEGESPLHQACAMMDAKDDLALLLIRSGKCDLIAKTKSDPSQSPCEIAALVADNNGRKIIEVLFEQGAATPGQIAKLFQQALESGHEETLVKLVKAVEDVEILKELRIKGLSIQGHAVARFLGRLREALTERGVYYTADQNGVVKLYMMKAAGKFLTDLQAKSPIKIMELRQFTEDLRSTCSLENHRQPQFYAALKRGCQFHMDSCKENDQIHSEGRAKKISSMLTEVQSLRSLLLQVVPERLIQLGSIESISSSPVARFLPEMEISLEGLEEYLPVIKRFLSQEGPWG